MDMGKVKVKKDCLWKQRTHKITKIRLSLIESLYMQHCSYEAAYYYMLFSPVSEWRVRGGGWGGDKNNGKSTVYI